MFGLYWIYSNDCNISNHCELPITADQSATLRVTTIITVPNGTSASFQGKVSYFFDDDTPSDLTIPGQPLCPYCAENICEHSCLWTLLPWTSDTAPDRIIFRSSQVFLGVNGQPMSHSMTLTLGAKFSLVEVSYHFALYGVESRNHFVTQM